MGMKQAIVHIKFKTLLCLLPRREKGLMENTMLFKVGGLESNNIF